MNRHISMPPCEQLVAMHIYPHQLDEQLLRTGTISSSVRSTALHRRLSMSSCDPLVATKMSHHHSHEFEETPVLHSIMPNATSAFAPSSSMNRHLSMSSYDQFAAMHHQSDEEQPLRIHVGNIPFLWTIDDLRKQFLVFGPVKDPEIVSNERGSKGFGFITFLRQSDGMNAIRVKNGSIADGRKITVALASSRSAARINSNLNPSHCCCCHTAKTFV